MTRPAAIALALTGCTDRLRADVIVVPSAELENVFAGTFQARRGARAEIRVELDGDPVLTVPAEVVGRDAHAALIGLQSDTVYRVVGVAGGQDVADSKLRTEEPPAALELALEESSPDADLRRGYVVMGYQGDWSGIVAVDGDGEPVWWDEAPRGWRASSPRLTRDGRAVLFLWNDSNGDLLEQRLVRVELDGSARTELVALRGHHMVEELDDGTFAWPAWDLRTVPWNGGGPADVLGDELLVGDGRSQPETLLSFFDDRGPPYVPCSHGEQTDERLGAEVYEWTHANSLVWIPEHESFVVVSRLLDAVLEVDRATGDVLWQIGGRDATLAYARPEDAFSHGHVSDAWADGLLVFDNGSHTERASRVLEYTLGGTGPVVTWEHPEPFGEMDRYLGDARRLPSGHVLVAWSTGPRIDEVTREGRLLWRLQGPDDATIGRIRYLSSLYPRPVADR